MSEKESLSIETVEDKDQAQTEALFVNDRINEAREDESFNELTNSEIAQQVIEDQEHQKKLSNFIEENYWSFAEDTEEFRKNLSPYTKTKAEIFEFLSSRLTSTNSFNESKDVFVEASKVYPDLGDRFISQLSDLIEKGNSDYDNSKLTKRMLRIANGTKDGQRRVLDILRPGNRAIFKRSKSSELQRKVIDNLCEVQIGLLDEKEQQQFLKRAIEEATHKYNRDAIAFVASNFDKVTDKGMRKKLENRILANMIQQAGDFYSFQPEFITLYMEELSKDKGKNTSAYLEKHLVSVLKNAKEITPHYIRQFIELFTDKFGDVPVVNKILAERLYSDLESSDEKSNSDYVKLIIKLAAKSGNKDACRRLIEMDPDKVRAESITPKDLASASARNVDLPPHLRSDVLKRYEDIHVRIIEEEFYSSSHLSDLVCLATDKEQAFKLIDDFQSIAEKMVEADRRQMGLGENEEKGKSRIDPYFKEFMRGLFQIAETQKFDDKEMAEFDRKIARILAKLFETGHPSTYDLGIEKETTGKILQLPQANDVLNRHILDMRIYSWETREYIELLTPSSLSMMDLRNKGFSEAFLKSAQPFLGDELFMKLISEYSSISQDVQERLLEIGGKLSDPKYRKLLESFGKIVNDYIAGNSERQSMEEFLPLFDDSFSEVSRAFVESSYNLAMFKQIPSKYPVEKIISLLRRIDSNPEILAKLSEASVEDSNLILDSLIGRKNGNYTSPDFENISMRRVEKGLNNEILLDFLKSDKAVCREEFIDHIIHYYSPDDEEILKATAKLLQDPTIIALANLEGMNQRNFFSDILSYGEIYSSKLTPAFREFISGSLDSLKYTAYFMLVNSVETDDLDRIFKELGNPVMEKFIRKCGIDHFEDIQMAFHNGFSLERISGEAMKNYLVQESPLYISELKKYICSGGENLEKIVKLLAHPATLLFEQSNYRLILELIDKDILTEELLNDQEVIAYLNNPNALGKFEILKYLSDDVSAFKELLHYLQDPKILFLKNKFEESVIISAVLTGGISPKDIPDDFESRPNDNTHLKMSVSQYVFGLDPARKEQYAKLDEAFTARGMLGCKYAEAILRRLTYKNLAVWTSDVGIEAVSKILDKCPPAIYLVAESTPEEMASLMESSLAQEFARERMMPLKPPTLEELRDPDRMMQELEPFLHTLIFRSEGKTTVDKMANSLGLGNMHQENMSLYSYLQTVMLGPELRRRIQEVFAQTPSISDLELKLVKAMARSFEVEAALHSSRQEFYQQDGYTENYLRHREESTGFTESQMLASKDVLTERGFSFVIHGTSEEAEQAIIGGMQGGRMFEAKGSPGFFTVFDANQAYLQGGAIIMLRDDLRSAYTNLEMSDYGNEWGVARLASSEPEQIQTIIRAIPRNCIALKGQAGNLETELTELLKREDLEKKSGLRSEAFTTIKERLKASPDFPRFHQTVLAIYESLRKAKVPESEILRTVDIYTSSFLIGRLYGEEQGEQSSRLQRIIEKLVLEKGNRNIDPYVFISYLSYYDQSAPRPNTGEILSKETLPALINFVNPSQSVDEMEKSLQKYIILMQQEYLQRVGWKPLFSYNRYLQEHGFPEELEFIPENMSFIMLGQRNGEDIKIARENSERVLKSIGELRKQIALRAYNEAIEESVASGEREGYEVPDRSTYSISLTSSTSRNEAVFGSDFDVLLLIDSSEIEAKYDIFFKKLSYLFSTKMQTLGYGLDSGGMHRTGFDVCLDELDTPTDEGVGRMAQRVEFTAMLDLKPLEEEDQAIVNRFIERTLAKMKEENEPLSTYLIGSGVDKFRKFFIEGSAQVMAGDPAKDIKVMFTRILNFEAYHLMLSNIDKVLESGEIPPASTTERMSFLERIGIFDGVEFISARDRVRAIIPEYQSLSLCEMLTAAHQDFLTWRLRSNVYSDTAHAAGVDPMTFTNVERERFNKHIIVIKEYLKASSSKIEGAKRLSEAPYIIS